MTHVWRGPEDALKESVLASHRVGLKDELQVIRTGGQGFYPLSRLVRPCPFSDSKPFAVSKLQGLEW